MRGKSYMIYSYPGDKQLFAIEVPQLSVPRDADFFRHYMQQSGRP